AHTAQNYSPHPPPPNPEYRRNQYGGTVGAPILKDKLFFFGGFQGQRFLAGITRISTVPTLRQRQGIFTGTPIYDPTTTVFNGATYVRQRFPNDTINKPLDPAAVALLNRYPLPTDTAATANNYTRTANDADHQAQFDIRFDLALHQHDRAFVRYSYFNDNEQPVTPLPDGSGAITGSIIGAGNVAGLSNVLGQQVVLGETHTFGARMLNDLRVGYTRRGNTINGATLSTTASAALGIPGLPSNAAFNNALPLFTITGLQQLGPSASTFSQFQTAVSQLVDTFSITSGKHTIKFGVDLRAYQLNAVAPPNPTGSFAFTTTGTNQQGTTGTGNALASFLLGQVDTFQIDLQTSKIRPRDHIEEYFVQDDWKLLPNLTLNIGARYTLHHPSTETTNQGAVFNLATQQLQYLGQNGFSRSARELHYDNVAPRFGFTYGITPRTVVRAGFGIVFIDQSGITTPFTTPQFPFIQNVAQRTQDSVNAAFKLSSGPTVAPIPLTPDAGLGQSVYTANRTLGSGYVQQWNLALQRAITQNLSVDVAYVGSHIVHVGIPDANLNQLTASQLALGSAALTAPIPNPAFGQIPSSSPIGGKTITLAQSLKPYPRFQNVAAYRNNTGTTNFNAFEAKIEQRLNRGVSLLLSYTHSKLIDDASSVFSSTVLSSPNTSSLIAADTFRPYLERDSSNGDVPNVLAASGIWQLPAGRNHRFASTALPNLFLGGWSLNAIYSMQSGMPVTITQGTNNIAFGGFVLQRPNIVHNPALPAEQRTPAKFFDTSAFANAGFAIGTASRNPVRGPAYRDLDMALIKHTALSERTNLELRAELFNVTNTPGFSQPNGSFGTTAFGSITSTTTDPRVLQLALRLTR
ncbi:TonB-dependent receptor, partial [Granulicella sp. dw_53]|uniref:TonB-dependent receptor n=1 Tax=Granulicella sp. dw_53 TaxID=2719792 RepID=UPI001BD40134